jgi:hypothetical protein
LILDDNLPLLIMPISVQMGDVANVPGFPVD